MEVEPSRPETAYVLGSDPGELDRLDRQAAWLRPATLELAGITSGMRVVDLGTGLGHVAGSLWNWLVRQGRSSKSIGLPRRCDPTTIGIQSYLPPNDPVGPALLAGVVRSLVGAITQYRIATIEQLGLHTLEKRIADELRAADAVLLPPTIVGAWGRRRISA